MAVTPPTGSGGGELWISGHGSLAVGTESLFAEARAIELLADELQHCRRALVTIDRALPSSLLVAADTPLSSMRAEEAMEEAAVLLDDAARTGATLAGALQSSAVLYGTAEEAATRLMQSLAADLASRFGFAAMLLAPILVPTALLAIAGVASGAALARAIDPRGTDRALAGFGRWLDDRKGVLSDPRFVQLVRFGVMSVDDALAGATGIPAPLIRALGDEGAGVGGLDTAAGTVAGVAGIAGALREGPVRVTAGAPVMVAPATGFADRADRIPRAPTQVRVDRLIQAGRPDRFEVYIAGTADFDPVAGTEPWDLTSNVTALSGAEGGSYRAVTEALRASGATADSQITVTGYSQGGLVGSMLAASGDYQVDALYTLGAPAGQVAVPDSVTWVAVEHTDDLVPAVGGTWSSADPLLVRREAFAGAPLDDAHLLPAHQLVRYQETAALADSSEESRLVAAATRFDDFGRGADRIESTLYSAERVTP